MKKRNAQNVRSLRRLTLTLFLSFICMGVILYVVIYNRLLLVNAIHSIQFEEHREDNQKVTSQSLKLPVKENITCNFPKLKIFDPTIIEYVEKPDLLNCEDAGHPLIFRTDLESNLIRINDPIQFGLTSCCYRNLIRLEFSDDSYDFGQECTPIYTDITPIPPTHEYIGIFCNNDTYAIEAVLAGETPELNDLTNFRVLDMFGMIPLKPKVEARIQKLPISNSSKPNIIIFGMDAMSRLNVIRTMPRTYRYLTEKLHGIGMEGYVKVGDNTFPNLTPVLMGLNISQLKTTCWNTTETEFDECPFIWKDFSSQGYRTSYGEDAAVMSAFNYEKAGFINPPTDYYLRTLLYAQGAMIAHEETYNAHLCYGPRLALSVLLDNVEKMAYKMGSNRPYFQFLWCNSISHDDLNLPMLADSHLLSTLTFLNEREYLKNSIFILMSDHGIRWGDIRSTHQGMVEERMPFLYIVFPDWFKKKYSAAFRNFKINVNRLTTPFDFHKTLKDLLDLDSNLSDEVIDLRLKRMNRNPIPRGISLFLRIPANRTCPMAEISEHWCVCHSSFPVPLNSTLVQNAAESVINVLNDLMEAYDECATLELFKIRGAQVSDLLKENEDFVNSTMTEVVTVTLETIPGHAVFETTVVHDLEEHDWTVGPISRTNLYGDQSHCVSDYRLKKFCYCKSLDPPEITLNS